MLTTLWTVLVVITAIAMLNKAREQHDQVDE